MSTITTTTPSIARTQPANVQQPAQRQADSISTGFQNLLRRDTTSTFRTTIGRGRTPSRIRGQGLRGPGIPSGDTPENPYRGHRSRSLDSGDTLEYALDPDSPHPAERSTTGGPTEPHLPQPEPGTNPEPPTDTTRVRTGTPTDFDRIHGGSGGDLPHGAGGGRPPSRSDREPGAEEPGDGGPPSPNGGGGPGDGGSPRSHRGTLDDDETSRTSGPPRTKVPKPDTPRSFTGKRNDWITFLLQAMIYFRHYPDYFKDDTNKCIHFLGWFEGDTVRPWANSILITIGTPKESELLTNWNKLLEVAAGLWGPINEKQTAQDRLAQLKQDSTIAVYTAKFQSIAHLSEYNDEALLQAYYKGLKSEIKDMMVSITRPTNLNDMLAAAIDFEARILERARERKAEEQHSKNRNTNERTTVRALRTPAEEETQKVDVKALRLSDEERTKRMREGRCFRCDETGHLAKDCPKKPKNPVKIGHTEGVANDDKTDFLST